jgi:hypothetical protein
MTALYILAAVLLLILLLMLWPASVQIRYQEDRLTVDLRLFGLIRIGLYPEDKKKGGKEKPAKKKAVSAVPLSRAERLMRMLQKINDLLPEVAQAAGYLLGKTTLSRCVILMELGKEDAAQTAIAVGQANAIGHALAARLASFIKVKQFNFQVRPNYIARVADASAEAMLRIAPLSGVIGGLSFLWRYRKLHKTNKKKIKRKGGAKHGTKTGK